MKVKYAIDFTGDTYHCLSIEEYLLNNLQRDTVFLFLWQSNNSVVIGKNQNPWEEINIPLLKSNNTIIARRVSGGGTVYHDRGNLNFSFITGKENFHRDKQIQVITRALDQFKIPLRVNEKYDLLMEDKKFSGSAFAFKRSLALHHGTLMVNVDLQKMSLLDSPMDFLTSAATCSRKSRVINLLDINREVTMDKLMKSIIDATANIYGQSPEPLYMKEITSLKEFKDIIRKHGSWEWLYGKTPTFITTYEKGQLTFDLHIKNGYIHHAVHRENRKRYLLNQRVPFNNEYEKNHLELNLEV